MRDTKEKIIAATVALTEEIGLEGAATAKIAGKASVAIGTLFHHFPNKQILFEATYRHIMDHYVWHLIGFFDYPDEQIGKQVKKAIRASVDYWVRNWRYFAFVDQMISSHYFTAEIAEETKSKMDKHFGQLFKLARRKGFIKKYDYQVLLDILFRTIFQSAAVIIDTEEDKKEKYRAECLRFIWSSIKP
ncbi:MAG: TetR/AcrR family transcriptional regulator [Saprospiraceae bacterium]|nr:TetR/AcrR family transcriptional regulator [Saprospiraceae bacterium]